MNLDGLKIKSITVNGFRSFGKNPQALEFKSLIATVWGPNSQGKTSLAEAFEFLLTGRIVRRELMASSQDEFSDALRNAHLPDEEPTFVEAEIESSDGSACTVKRTLTTDYAKRQVCQSTLEINGKPANEGELTSIGIVLSQPPLEAPVLAQHTLGYLFSAKPQDRSIYFKALLEVTDLEEFRNTVASLEAELMPPDDPVIELLDICKTVSELREPLFSLSHDVPSKEDIAAAVERGTRALIESAGG